MQSPKKLKRTIISYFILANVLIGIIGFGGASYSFYGQLNSLTMDKLGQAVDARAGAISEWLRLAIIVGTQPSHQSWGKISLENYYQDIVSREDLVETTARVIDGALTYNQDIKGMARLDRSGRPILHRGQEIPSSFQPDLDPAQTRVKISFIKIERLRPQLLVSSPLLGRGGNFLGLDVVLLDTDPLLRLLSESYGSGLEARTYMTSMEDGSQRLIYSSEESEQGQLPEEIKTMIAKALEAENSVVSTEELAYAVGQVSNADWRIAIITDKNLLLKPLKDQIRRTAGYFIIFFAFALTGLWIFALRPLTGRVEKTTEALEEEVEETTEKLIKESEGRKKTESRLAVATHRAQVARQAKSQFLANLSHEIRTPLNAVIGMTDLTLYTDLTKEQYSYLSEVKKAAGNLLVQINDLLDLSKLQDGLMITESRSFNLAALLKQVVKNFELQARDKQIEFKLNLGHDIDPLRLGDQFRLKQILNYLLDNAIKFTEAGGRVALNVAAVPDEGQRADLIRFEVEDSGVGIAPDRLETIFDPFVQADESLTRSSGGTGMGLAVTKRLLELMNGDITVESTPGQGSRFILTVSLPPSPEKPEEEESPLSLDEMRGLKAVLADDNEVNLRILEGYLKHWGFEVHSFGDGSAVLVHLEKNPEVRPDVFILDALMPGLTTEELEKELTGKYPTVPIVFLTSLESSTIENRRGQGAATTFTIGKPVQQDQLRNGLAALLSDRKDKKINKTGPADKLGRVDQPRTILVVDDNQLNRRLASTLLSKRGHNVDEAENGRDALSAISGKKYDMVFMDIQMPIMDGLSAVREIRQKPEIYGADLPVVAMTAHALPGDQESFLNAGMTAYISKPFKPIELIAAAETYRTAVDNSKKYNGGSIVAAELDRSAIMENFMDDEELLFESIDLFLERIDSRMTSLRESVAAKDPDVFMPEAHTIKGMIGIFSTGQAFEAAKKLELKGREKNTEGIDQDLAELESELKALTGALREWRSGN